MRAAAMRALLHWYFAPQKHLSPRDQRWYAIQLRSLPLGGAVHLALIALFTAVGVPVLAWLNAASAVVYAIASVACRLGRHRIAFWLMGLELIVHAWIGVRQIGWATGVSYPLFLLPLLSGPMSMPGDRRTVGITPGDRRALSILGGGTLLVLRDAGAPAVVLDDRVVFVMFSLSILTVFAFTRTVVAVLEGTATRLETELLRERAKSEGLLKDELSHQITARSRELGRMLASADATLVPGRPRVGERFGERYRVERELGAGAMGAVFEVVRVTDDRRLALKVVTGEVSADRAARFAREAEIGARVRHANLVEIVDVGVAAGGVPYLAMELAPAGSLETCRERFGDVRWARPLLLGIARGLSALHEAGVVHRDLKPANVLVIGEDQAKISDFGISRFGELDPSVDPAGSTLAASRPQALTATGMLLGTPYYMAPEAVRGAKVESSADVFAFGILAVEMLTGCAPFVTPPMFRVLAGEKLEEPRGLDAIEPRLRELLTACLAEAPTSRPTIRMILDVLAG